MNDVKRTLAITRDPTLALCHIDLLGDELMCRIIIQSQQHTSSPPSLTSEDQSANEAPPAAAVAAAQRLSKCRLPDDMHIH